MKLNVKSLENAYESIAKYHGVEIIEKEQLDDFSKQYCFTYKDNDFLKKGYVRYYDMMEHFGYRIEGMPSEKVIPVGKEVKLLKG